MKADVNHYDKILPSLVIERDLAYSDLKEVCTTTRFQSLESYLLNQYESTVMELQKGKTRKLKNLTSSA